MCSTSFKRVFTQGSKPMKEEITNTFDKETFEQITFERSQKIYTVVCSILQLLPDSVCKAG